MNGQCLCGTVRIGLARAPEYINACNCRFCRSLGAAWGYFPKGEVTIDGDTASYARKDLDDVWLAGHFCPTCGSTTHYSITKDPSIDRIVINMRLFDMDAIDGIEVRYLDGRKVETEADDYVRTAIGHIGDGTAF